MTVQNIAATALFDSLKRNQLDPQLLLDGTHLNYNDILNVKKKHSWNEFLIMYQNVANLLGPDKAAKEIAYHGLYNENLSPLRKFGSGFFDSKNLYWAISTFVSKYLYKECVAFHYRKIDAHHVVVEINIHPELEDCPLLLETYKYLFENAPTVLGLSKALVTSNISERRGEYHIHLVYTSFFKFLISRFLLPNESHRNFLLLMTELESKSIELSKLIDEKSELLRIMSHDISNSAALVEMSLSKVLKKGDLVEEDREIIEKAKRGSDRLCSILKNVQKLEVAHLRGVNLGPVDIDQVFSAIHDSFKDQLAMKNIRFVLVNHLPANIFANAEKSSLEVNVLSNLVSNAIKFSNVNSEITLEADLENGQIAILVIDQGRGISSIERKNLFAKKLRHSTVGTSGEVGTGFGLGIVKTYVQLYGGQISVEANLPAGSIFKICLPIHTQQAINKISMFNDSHFSQITTLQ